MVNPAKTRAVSITSVGAAGAFPDRPLTVNIDGVFEISSLNRAAVQHRRILVMFYYGR